MVRAGVVDHPTKWEFCGYNEIQSPRKRKGIIDFDRLVGLLGFESYDDFKNAHYKWVDSAMQTNNRGIENKWTQSIAVGSKPFVEKVREALGFRAKGRKTIHDDDTFELLEVLMPYGETNSLNYENTLLWEQRPQPLISKFLYEN